MQKLKTLFTSALCIFFVACNLGPEPSQPQLSYPEDSIHDLAVTGLHNHSPEQLSQQHHQNMRLLPRAKKTMAAGPHLKTMAVPLGADVQVRLKILLITTPDYQDMYEAAKLLLLRVGVPFDTLDATTTPLLSTTLETSPGLGNYDAIVLTSGSLGMQASNGDYMSAFDANEWQLLADYERSYRIRQVALYDYPNSDNGTDYLSSIDPSLTPTNLKLATEGRNIWTEIQPSASIPLEDNTYTATLAGATPVLTTTSGAVVASIYNYDGREQLSFFSWQNDLSSQTRNLGYGWLRWVTRNLFLGERKMYFSLHIDDYFLPTNIWDPVSKTNKFSYRITPVDVNSFIGWQNSFRNTYPSFSTFTGNMFFNGLRYQFNSPSNCSVKQTTTATSEALSAFTRCIQNNFNFTSHTFSHITIDENTSLATLRSELGENVRVATGQGGLALGTNFDANALVTGGHTGLGDFWFRTPPYNAGKSASNPNLIVAAKEYGITNIASHINAETSYPQCRSTTDDCNQAPYFTNEGLVFPNNLPSNNILLVPRYGTFVAYNASTPTEQTSVFNETYRYSFGRDLSYAEIIAEQARRSLLEITNFAANPPFVHQTNIRRYTKSTGMYSCITCDWLNALALRYSSIYNLPVVNLTQSKIETMMRRRAAFRAAKPSAIWNKTKNSVAISASNASPIPLSNTAVGEAYGTDKVVWLNGGDVVSLGAPTTNRFASPNNLATNDWEKGVLTVVANDMIAYSGLGDDTLDRLSVTSGYQWVRTKLNVTNGEKLRVSLILASKNNSSSVQLGLYDSQGVLVGGSTAYQSLPTSPTRVVVDTFSKTSAMISPIYVRISGITSSDSVFVGGALADLVP